MFKDKTFIEKVSLCVGMSFNISNEPFHKNETIIQRYQKHRQYIGGYNDEYIIDIFDLECSKSIIVFNHKTDMCKNISEDDMQKICFILQFQIEDSYTELTKYLTTKMKFGVSL